MKTFVLASLCLLAQAAAAASDIDQCLLQWQRTIAGAWEATNRFVGIDNVSGNNRVSYRSIEGKNGVFTIELKVVDSDLSATYRRDSKAVALQTSEPWVTEAEIYYHTHHCSEEDGRYVVVQRYAGTNPTTKRIMDYEDRWIATADAVLWTASGRESGADEPFAPFLAHHAVRPK